MTSLLSIIDTADQLTPEQCAEICVALQYVPGWPNAREIWILSGKHLMFVTDANGVKDCKGFADAPDFNSLDAVKAAEVAKGADGVDLVSYPGEWFATIHKNDGETGAQFRAPSEPLARIGALLKMGRE